MRRFFLWISIGILSGACSLKKQNVAIHYPVDSLLNAQLSFMASESVTLEKNSLLNDSTGTETIEHPDSLRLAKELAVLFELNSINKPIYADAYTVETANDKTSNLQIKSFQAKGDQPLKDFKVYYLEHPAAIRKIMATIQSENSMYQGTKSFELNFLPIRNQSVLHSFTINGGQKIIAGDTTIFKITTAFRF